MKNATCLIYREPTHADSIAIMENMYIGLISLIVNPTALFKFSTLPTDTRSYCVLFISLVHSLKGFEPVTLDRLIM